MLATKSKANSKVNILFFISRLFGSLILCVIILTYIVAIGLCVLCVWSGSLHSLPQYCILEYILPTKPKRAIISVISDQ
ncbi:MAG: hypothetical protein BEV12_06330 [Microcystis aeruginosa CACIAM 03]|nr:MAG: hypothetical protein BEV12_06330 [Microcystis aeruginosa CACIAM 03]